MGKEIVRYNDFYKNQIPLDHAKYINCKILTIRLEDSFDEDELLGILAEALVGMDGEETKVWFML